MNDDQTLLGTLAVQRRWITKEQLASALALHQARGARSRIGTIFVDEGWITIGQLEELLDHQQALRTPGSPTPRVITPPAPPASDDGWKPGMDPFAAAEASRGKAAPAKEQESPFDDGIELDWSPPSQKPASPGGLDIDFSDAPADEGMLDLGGAVLDFGSLELDSQKPTQAAHAPATAREIELDDSGGSLELGGHREAAALQAPPPAQQVTPSTKAGPVFHTGQRPPSKHLDAYLEDAARKRGSDVHFHPNSPMQVRIDGHLVAQPLALTNQQIETIVLAPLTPSERAAFNEEGQIDFAHSVEGIGRFRSNVYKTNHGINGVFRFIPNFVPTLEQLGIPPELAKVTQFHQGMVLCTGPVGCGKSTTLAALVDVINQTKQDHILTIEDPIEYLHPSKKALVNQRQVNRHTESFGRALRGALREDPDVIVIGELRDLETISLAMTAAETGHLVLGTLHTGNAIRTINRLIGAFPPEEQGQVRTMLSESLRAVVSQRLIPRADGKGRVPAIEVLRMNRAVANTIRENRTFQLRSALQTGKNQGQILLDNSLADLVKRGVVKKADALRFAEDPRLIP